jgi:hypothetical protein
MNTVIFKLMIVTLYTCTDNTPKRELLKNSSQDLFKSSVILTNDTSRPRGADSAKSKYSAKTDVLGVWAFIGEQNAAFDIQKDRIIYPEDTKVYKYKIIKDSIQFDYGGYKVICKVELKGKDTLVLTGADTQVYYRFKH